MKNILPALLISLILTVHSCKSVDLRTQHISKNDAKSLERRGRDLLEESKLAMGYQKLINAEVYETTTVFDWTGFWLMVPMNTFPGNNKKQLKLRFATNSFDGQVEYLEGRKKGKIMGLQSWEGYEVENGSDYLRRHEHDRYLWGLATYHYLVEAPLHLPNAEIVRYAGTKLLDGIDYKLVYVTWGSEEPNKQYDRMLVYINPESKFIDLLEVTINDFFLPMPKGMQHATARYNRSKTEIGTYLPSKITIQLKSPKKKNNKVYSMDFSDYSFDSFDKEKLYPIENIQYYGFTKPESHAINQ